MERPKGFDEYRALNPVPKFSVEQVARVRAIALAPRPPSPVTQEEADR